MKQIKQIEYRDLFKYEDGTYRPFVEFSRNEKLVFILFIIIFLALLVSIILIIKSLFF